ncbi:NADH-quinone oxidoreductase subunit NuoH [Desulfatiferula olefinivorans]
MEQIIEYITTYSLLRMLLAFVCLIGIIFANAIVMGYLERKIAARIQRRWGPMEIGVQGWLQMILDGVKMLSKQLIVPKDADRFLFRLAPLLCFTPVAMIFAALPFSRSLYGINLNLGLIYIIAMGSINVFAILIAGWSSNNKYSLFGAMRSVAQNVSYEIPILLSLLAVVLTTATFDLQKIVEAQSGWLWFVVYPNLFVAFVIYLVAGCAETNRAPFDLPEAESELTAGFHTEYSGFGFGLFAVAEYGNLFIMASMATIMFLGGWNGPFGLLNGPLTGAVWFLLKVFVLMLVMIWVRWTFPRVRFDQLMNLAWKYLIPFSLVNLLITALVVKIL